MLPNLTMVVGLVAVQHQILTGVEYMEIMKTMKMKKLMMNLMNMLMIYIEVVRVKAQVNQFVGV